MDQLILDIVRDLHYHMAAFPKCMYSATSSRETTLSFANDVGRLYRSLPVSPEAASTQERELQ